ncbi:RWDD1 protein, partial [Polyodon spathula]|nr:RWDD1 protein [Polyodon spathula]
MQRQTIFNLAPRVLSLANKVSKDGDQYRSTFHSGKQLFETDHNLDTSDIHFLEEAGNNVEVDESLFQDIDDLELEEDDPDFNLAHLGSDED